MQASNQNGRASLNLLSAFLTRIWKAGFTLLGRLRPAQVDWWTSDGSQRMLVVAPHPDDETFGCGGAIIRHVAAGDGVWVAIVTDGRQSRALGLEPEEMVIRRQQEANTAMQTMGVKELRWLGLPEGQWTAKQLQARLRTPLDEIRPRLIYAPSRIDFHPHHLAVAHALASVLPDYLDIIVRVYPAQVPLSAALTNLVCDVSPVRQTLETAFQAYVTQSDNIDRARRQRQYAAGRYGCKLWAEEFWQMTAASYIQLHKGQPETWGGDFRSLRYRSFGDLLAYWHGRSERQRLRQQTT